MSYAIVGFGKIGQALAHAFARKNINVTVRESPATRGAGTGGPGDWTHGRRQVAAGCAQGRHNHLGGPVRGTS
jgi:glycine/D-amino acid oxidase-like deaminating enzyme